MKLYNIILISERSNIINAVYLKDCKSIPWIRAYQEIFDFYDSKKSEILEYIDDFDGESELPEFDYVKNGVKFTVRMEESLFDEIANLTRPKVRFPKYQLN
jgi:hypothetical protein